MLPLPMPLLTNVKFMCYQEAYTLFAMCDMQVLKEEMEAVDSLRYSFEVLQNKSVSIII